MCPGSYIVANAAWSRVFTEQIITMVHSAGNVESVMSELGCRNFICSSEFEIQNPMNFGKYQFKHSAVLLSVSLRMYLGAEFQFLLEMKTLESHEIQTLTLH